MKNSIYNPIQKSVSELSCLPFTHVHKLVKMSQILQYHQLKYKLSCHFLTVCIQTCRKMWLRPQQNKYFYMDRLVRLLVLQACHIAHLQNKINFCKQ